MTLPLAEAPFRDAGTAQLVAGEALVLRAAAIRLVGPAPLAPGLSALAAACGPRAWEVFLEAESCALPLARALRGHPLSGELSDAVRATIARRESAEVQRVLVARWQLAELDRLAAARGLAPCVIKGGALAASDQLALDLGDIDLLVAPSDIAPIAAVLAEMGLHPAAGIPLFAERTAPVKTAFAGDGLLDVELHTELRYGAARRVLDVARRREPGRLALDRWTGALAAAAVLVHSTEHHPHRCGHLRDVLLLAELLRGVEGGEREVLMVEVSASRARVAIAEMLRLADGVGGGSVPEDSPRMRTIAARKYLDAQVPATARGAQFLGSRGVASYLPLATEGVADAYRLIPRTSHARRPPWGFAAALSRRVIAAATRAAHLVVDVAALARGISLRGEVERLASAAAQRVAAAEGRASGEAWAVKGVIGDR